MTSVNRKLMFDRGIYSGKVQVYTPNYGHMVRSLGDIILLIGGTTWL